jgi:integrase
LPVLPNNVRGRLNPELLNQALEQIPKAAFNDCVGRQAGHEERVVPITDELLPILLAAFDEAPEGEHRLITLGQGGQRHRALRRICAAAGVAPWKDAFQTLRRSCEKQWAMEYPQFAVSKWIGHSITVSGRHYANDVPDELYARAAASTKPPKKKHALQIALQQAAA